jgi:hypothetical protein
MKHKLHKKVDKIKTSMPWEVHPYLAISIKDFNWMRETIISLEKENQRHKQALEEIIEYHPFCRQGQIAQKALKGDQ